MTSFSEAMKLYFTRAFDFQGRSTRAEFWWARLMFLIGYVALSLLAVSLGELAVFVFLIAFIIIIIPDISLSIRRLHDTDKTGWWYLLALVPFGGLILLFFFCAAGTSGPNKFGEDPYGNIALDVFN